LTLKEQNMPEKKTIEKARRDLKQGKSASTAAGEFVREEIDHIREGKHGARSAKQAIAIGLSKARRAGVPLNAPTPGKTSTATRRSAQRDVEVGQGTRKPRSSSKRRQATTRALQREPRAAASKTALSRHAKAAASGRRTAPRASTASSAANETPRRSGGASKRRRKPASTSRRARTSSAQA
jgi:hypothetical protein